MHVNDGQVITAMPYEDVTLTINAGTGYGVEVAAVGEWVGGDAPDLSGASGVIEVSGAACNRVRLTATTLPDIPPPWPVPPYRWAAWRLGAISEATTYQRSVTVPLNGMPMTVQQCGD